MDKLVKRAGVAMLVVLATLGSAFAWGLARHASAIGRSGPPRLRMDAALKRPTAPLFAAVSKPAAVAIEAANAPKAEPPRPSGRAVGATAKKPAQRLRSPDLVPDPSGVPDDLELLPPPPDDLLDFGPGGRDREAKLSERGAKAFSVRQPGGAAQEHKLVSDRGERVTFETDLARPGDH